MVSTLSDPVVSSSQLVVRSPPVVVVVPPSCVVVTSSVVVVAVSDSPEVELASCRSIMTVKKSTVAAVSSKYSASSPVVVAASPSLVPEVHSAVVPEPSSSISSSSSSLHPEPSSVNSFVSVVLLSIHSLVPGLPVVGSSVAVLPPVHSVVPSVVTSAVSALLRVLSDVDSSTSTQSVAAELPVLISAVSAVRSVHSLVLISSGVVVANRSMSGVEVSATAREVDASGFSATSARADVDDTVEVRPDDVRPRRGDVKALFVVVASVCIFPDVVRLLLPTSLGVPNTVEDAVVVLTLLDVDGQLAEVFGGKTAGAVVAHLPGAFKQLSSSPSSPSPSTCAATLMVRPSVSVLPESPRCAASSTSGGSTSSAFRPSSLSSSVPLVVVVWNAAVAENVTVVVVVVVVFGISMATVVVVTPVPATAGVVLVHVVNGGVVLPVASPRCGSLVVVPLVECSRFRALVPAADLPLVLALPGVEDPTDVVGTGIVDEVHGTTASFGVGADVIGDEVNDVVGDEVVTDVLFLPVGNAVPVVRDPRRRDDVETSKLEALDALPWNRATDDRPVVLGNVEKLRAVKIPTLTTDFRQPTLTAPSGTISVTLAWFASPTATRWNCASSRTAARSSLFVALPRSSKNPVVVAGTSAERAVSTKLSYSRSIVPFSCVVPYLQRPHQRPS